MMSKRFQGVHHNNFGAVRFGELAGERAFTFKLYILPFVFKCFYNDTAFLWLFKNFIN